MHRANGGLRWATVMAGLFLLVMAGPFWADDAKGNDRKATDKAIHAGLREAINHGATLFNDQGDYAGCYRIFHGALLAVKPLLAHRPDLQKAIDEGIAAAEKNPRMTNRAFTLRKVLDDVRANLVPPEKKVEKKAEEKKIEKKAEEKKTEKKVEKKEEKKIEKKAEEKKTEKKAEEKKVEKKAEEKKAEKKAEEKKKANDKKKEEKKNNANKEKKAEFIDLKSSFLEDLPAQWQRSEALSRRVAVAWIGCRRELV